jgi:hypothetical protein
MSRDLRNILQRTETLIKRFFMADERISTLKERNPMTVLVQTIRGFIAVPEIDLAKIARQFGLKVLDIVVSMIADALKVIVISSLLALWLASGTLGVIGEILANLH